MFSLFVQVTIVESVSLNAASHYLSILESAEKSFLKFIRSTVNCKVASINGCY